MWTPRCLTTLDDGRWPPKMKPLNEVDAEIPVEHYHAVAEVIGYVMGLKRGLSGRRA